MFVECESSILDFQRRDTHDDAPFFGVIDDLGLGADRREQAFRRAVFNIATSNCDDHTENHAFTLDATGAWDLAPAYDVTHAHNPTGEWTSRHLMGIDGIFYDVGRDHLLRFADRFAVPTPRAIIDDINTAVAAWPDFARSAELQREPTHRIRQDLHQI